MLRRTFLWSAAGLPAAVRAAPLADAVARPATPIRLSSKPTMLRIARAGQRIVAVGERGVVLLSDDDGATWRQAQVPVSVTLTGVQFVDARRGWAIGHAAVVLETRDGGESWALRHDGRSLPDGLANPLLDLHFGDDGQGWAVGAYGLAIQTDDSGKTWHSRGESLPNPKGLHFYGIARVDQRIFIAGEQGVFLSVATDGDRGGAALLSTPYRGSFFALKALGDGALLLGGLRGTLLHRDSAGEFRPIDSGGSEAIVSMALAVVQPSPPSIPAVAEPLALIDQSGRVRVGRTAFGPYAALPFDSEHRWNAIVAVGDALLVGAGNQGVGRLATAPSLGAR